MNGITRQKVIELSRSTLVCREELLSVRLLSADPAFSRAPLVDSPVFSIDGREIRRMPVWALSLPNQAAYEALIHDCRPTPHRFSLVRAPVPDVLLRSAKRLPCGGRTTLRSLPKDLPQDGIRRRKPSCLNGMQWRRPCRMCSSFRIEGFFDGPIIWTDWI